MSKNKITRWIDLQNEKINFATCRTYYRKIEAGKQFYYIFHPRFYPRLVLRFFLVLCNFFRFNSKLYLPYSKVLNTTLNHKKPYFKSLFTKTFEFFSVFAGLTYFIKPEFSPSYYESRIPLNELFLKREESPLVSIIIPVYNQLQFTLNCLRSIQLNISDKYSFEVIVIDDYSTDATKETLAKIPNIKFIRNLSNLGFLKSCNYAVKQAIGQYICLLNNDTLVLPNWLESLIDTIESDISIGCVGSKLMYPYGLLQEAGGIIFKDASGSNFGK